MIAMLEGTVAEKLPDTVVVNVSGVGYGIFTTAEDSVVLESGQPAKLFIYEHIRENVHDLYGFISKDTKSLFELVLTVNGVGPRMALNILSIGSAGNVKQAIASGDVKFIQQASGVGKRVAERVVVDLKDKVGLASVDIEQTGILQAESKLVEDEAVQALVSLGFSSHDAIKALHGIDETLKTEERVRRALKAKHD